MVFAVQDRQYRVILGYVVLAIHQDAGRPPTIQFKESRWMALSTSRAIRCRTLNETTPPIGIGRR